MSDNELAPIIIKKKKIIQGGGRVGHGVGLSGELHRFGTMTIALKRQMS